MANRLSIAVGETPTKGAVRRAGEILRKFQLGEVVLDDKSHEQYLDAYGILVSFRSLHQYPLIKTTNGVRSAVSAEGCKVEVSQRLKRIPTILDKLRREPKMDLSRMQDFGGCRAVLENEDEVRRVQERVAANHKRRYGTDPHIKDYISAPRETGYRGVHVIVSYDGRLVEVQLRTKVMHEWAITVERFSGQSGVNFKSAEGPPKVSEFFTLVSELMAIEEMGGTVDEGKLLRLSELRTTALEFANRGFRDTEGE